jgi:hypothetical protein
VKTFRLSLAILGATSFVNGLGGCAYLETQLQRKAPPDQRITLGWQDRVSVFPRDVANYRCEHDYFLRCDRAGSISLSCTCALR